jgi:hypothetical protein
MAKVLNVETQQSYRFNIATEIAPKEAFERIARVSEWWTKGFAGATQKRGDEFSVRFGDTFVDFEVAEVVPERKVVWRVTDCHLHFIKDKTEWKDTQVVFEITSEAKKTNVSMTHRGLVPTAECYDNCEAGWNFYVGESLRKYLNDGKGLPDGRTR